MSPMIRTTLAAALFAATSVTAHAEDASSPVPPVYKAVLDCRAIADPAQRLACFDHTVEAMAAAGRDNALVVLDRDAMRENRKGIFGLQLPKLRIFGSGDDDVEEITSTIARLGGDRGGWTFYLADGAIWRQIDSRKVFAKAGDTIKIRKAALGSFMASVRNAPGVRVKRVVTD